jgi:hypothetical protein
MKPNPSDHTLFIRTSGARAVLHLDGSALALTTKAEMKSHGTLFGTGREAHLLSKVTQTLSMHLVGSSFLPSRTSQQPGTGSKCYVHPGPFLVCGLYIALYIYVHTFVAICPANAYIFEMRRYTGSNVVADVSYDIFTSPYPDGPASYEIMIWVGALGGAGPISSTGSPVATVNIAGATWKLYKGPNTSWTVFSFVAETEQTTFNADLMDFFHYLIQNEGFSASQYVQHIASGTEPFDGTNAQLTTTEYMISVN